MAGPETLPAQLLTHRCVHAAGLQEGDQEGEEGGDTHENTKHVPWLCPEDSWFCIKDSSGLILKTFIIELSAFSAP